MNSDGLKTITRRFKKVEYRRHPYFWGEKPNLKEIKIFILKMIERGYVLLENSISVRNINPEYPIWKIWGWFVFVGKRKISSIGYSYNKEKNKFERLNVCYYCPEKYALLKEGCDNCE